jgi:ATP-dependent RNA helicase DeaD
VHGELPTNADAYTHRSGRTGRAGRKGTSSLLVAPIGVVRATRLLRGLGIAHRFEPIPTAEEILKADDARLFEDLTAAARSASVDAEGEGDESVADDQEALERWRALAERLVEAGNVEQTLMRLLRHARRGVTEPRVVRVFAERQKRDEADFGGKRRDRDARGRLRERADPAGRDRGAQRFEARPAKPRNRDAREFEPRVPSPASEVPDRGDASPRVDREEPRARAARHARDDAPAAERAEPRSRSKRDGERATPQTSDAEFTSFHVSWGQRDGADARRLLAMLCRRGQIRGRDVGAIRVEGSYSLVQVANSVAPDFARSASRPDPREPDVVIRPDRAQPAEALEASKTKLRTNPFQRAKKGKPGGHRPPKRHKPPARAR